MKECWGLLANFETEEALLNALHVLKKAGYHRLDAFTPYPVASVIDALGHGRSRLPAAALAAGAAGAAGSFGFASWVSLVDYPMNIGGRSLFSWQAFFPVMLVTALLLSSVGVAAGFLILGGLPRLYHPVFNSETFSRVSTGGFFLCIEASDPAFDHDKTRNLLEESGSLEVSDVAA